MRRRSIRDVLVRPWLLVALVACGSGDRAPAITGDAGAHVGSPVDSSAPPAADDASAPADSSSPEAGDGSMASVDAASPADAPVSDGGRDYSTDRSLFLGASRCAQAGVQLCEDFESGSINKSVWTVSGTAPVVDGVQAARGSKALHITQKGNGLSYIKETMTFSEPNNTYFGRVFVYFNSLAGPPMTYAHWTIIAASGTGVSGEIRVSGQLQNGKNLFGVGTDNRVDPMGTGDWTNSDNDPTGMPSAVPLKQWICIEWMHKGNTNETRFWWDATEHRSLYTSSSVHGGNTMPYLLPQFTNVWIGWQEYQTSTETFELWMDEVAIDTARIGCVL
jgi:hypothetical protein